jgi:hypothetical protein
MSNASAARLVRDGGKGLVLRGGEKVGRQTHIKTHPPIHTLAHPHTYTPTHTCLVESLVLVPAVPEGPHCVDVERVLPLADSGGALLGDGLLQHSLVHLSKEEREEGRRRGVRERKEGGRGLR